MTQNAGENKKISETQITVEQNKTKEKQRQEGIELLRILSMLMILLLHYCGKGGFLKPELFHHLNGEIAWIIESLSIVAVNCYVLISGYFLVNSKCERKKVLKIGTQVLFYSIGIFFIFKVIGKADIPLKEEISYIFPIISKTYWFVTCYIVMYLLAPFINTILKNTDKKNTQILIIILLAISWSSSLLYYLKFDVIDNTQGYGIIWFITLYVIAGYIRLYGKEKNKKYLYLLLYVIISAFIYLSRIVMTKVFPDGKIQYNMFYAYNSVPVTLSSICLFMFFKQVKLHKEFMKKIVLKIAPLTFAVYLIHEHPLIRKILYTKILHTDLFLYSKKFMISIFLSCIGIFITCCIIEFVRKTLMKYTHTMILKIKNNN